ncbi:GNAT superfamily N-acetyltransferase [Microbacterium paludicola]|uniref:GNAT superfamily N-acetyltransferase n=1 Tax=Microbacterium paludicola TaxID=300019 RepID=A0ABU1HWR8_9MICO|nr:GNAT family N-acetyltransferase [Microbacterium paludicola]MDR6165870.1 GNAT superfamily N-acetyltransferase [Microbacterium paludicola]
MSETTIVPVTPGSVSDAQHAMSGGGDGHECQCQWWTMTNADFQRTDIDGRASAFRSEVDAAPSPGLIAYVDGVAAGWVRVGPRTRQIRLSKTRAYAGATEEPWDDADVWAVSCFAVRKEHRGSGLNAALLRAAIAFARENGARVVEAYPVDPDAGRKVTSNELYHGALSTFLSAGFREVARPKPHVAVVSLDLADTHETGTGEHP